MIDWNNILELYAERPLFITSGEIVTYSEFHNLTRQFGEGIEGASSFSIHPEWSPQSFASMLGALEAGVTAVLDATVIKPDLSPFDGSAPLLILASGGTSGTTKHIVHSWKSFLAAYSVKSRDPQNWLVLYAAAHIAGLDAFLKALHRGSTLVIASGTGVDVIGNLIEQHQVQVIAATPSLLQFQLIGGLHRSYDLSSVRWIPFGAEIMPETLFGQLSKAFPNAVLMNRFGMTETGVLPVSSDPKDPQALFLNASGYAWKLKDGEIYIKSATSFLGTLQGGRHSFDSGWYPTGDLGEVTEQGSIRVLGRKESVINVGGLKILPEQVEHLLLDEPDIEDAMAFPVSHRMTGQAVAAKVVSRQWTDSHDLVKRLRSKIKRAGKSLALVPVKIELVSSIDRTGSGKRLRPLECLDLDP